MTWDESTERRSIPELLIRMDEKLTNALKRQEEFDKFVHGTNGESGAKTNIKILLDHKKNSEKHTFAAWTAAIGLVFKTIWDLLTNK